MLTAADIPGLQELQLPQAEAGIGKKRPRRKPARAPPSPALGRKWATLGPQVSREWKHASPRRVPAFDLIVVHVPPPRSPFHLLPSPFFQGFHSA
jgi:hypothetical protein